ERKNRNQENRDNANVTKGFHAARPPDLLRLRSENACAAAATALAEDTRTGVGAATCTGAGSGASSGSAADCGRAAMAILQSRPTTLSASPSCFLSCSDISVAEASWLARFSLTSA